MGYLLDTLVWLDVLCGRLAPADVAAVTGNEPIYLSPMTVALLRLGAERATEPSVRARRQAAVVRLARKPLLRIDAATAEIHGALRAQARADEPETGTEQLWLAAQAIQHGLRLLTYSDTTLPPLPGLDLAHLPVRRA